MRLMMVLASVALIAVACGTDDDEPTNAAAGAVDATVYLDAVTAIGAEFVADAEEVNGLLQQTWPVRDRLIDVLTEADRTSLFKRMLTDAQSLPPPARVRR